MYGFLIRNTNGDILIDGEHVHPKLYQIVPLVCAGMGLATASFIPTSKMIFATAHSTDTLCTIVGIGKNSSGLWINVTINAASAGNVKVKVYEL